MYPIRSDDDLGESQNPDKGRNGEKGEMNGDDSSCNMPQLWGLRHSPKPNIVYEVVLMWEKRREQ